MNYLSSIPQSIFFSLVFTMVLSEYTHGDVRVPVAIGRLFAQFFLALEVDYIKLNLYITLI